MSFLPPEDPRPSRTRRPDEPGPQASSAPTVLIRLIDVGRASSGYSLDPFGPNFVGLPADDARRWASIREHHGSGDEVEVSPQLADRLVRVLGAARAA